MKIIEYINCISTNYEHLFDAVGNLGNIFISLGLVWMAYRANKIANSNLTLAGEEKASRKYRMDKDEREIFRAVYQTITKALYLVHRDGRVEKETSVLFWQARNQARLELPEDIQDYAEKLFKAAHEAFTIDLCYLKNLPVGEKRTQKVEEEYACLSILLDANPYEVFSKYMKIKAVVE